MIETDRVRLAADAMATVARHLDPALLTAPTPCADYDVGALVRHLLYWGPSLEGAGRKQTVPPPATPESETVLPDDPVAALLGQLDRTAAAWASPDSWTATTHMGGPTELPAVLVGGMVAGELLVHGWDLARALGLGYAPDTGLVAYAHDEAVRSAEQARAMGVYGPEVPVSAAASTLDRLLGVTGRDPAWRRPAVNATRG